MSAMGRGRTVRDSGQRRQCDQNFVRFRATFRLVEQFAQIVSGAT